MDKFIDTILGTIKAVQDTLSARIAALEQRAASQIDITALKARQADVERTVEEIRASMRERS